MVEPSFAIGLFSTPVVVVDLPAMDAVNAEIAAQLLAEERVVPSWQRANVGGWHSAPDLSQRPQPCFQTLLRTVVDQVAGVVRALASDMGIAKVPAYRYGVTAWGMILRDGHYVTVHDHGDVHWSVAYYVDAGDDAPEPSGRLAFVDPRRSGRSIPDLDLFPSSFDIQPRTSALVIFPGWLQHHVHAYRGQRPRICVSANLTMEAVR
ncbi:MAG TPA: TIGR02466 family protein [Kofleriaceae bacterium]|nr:TIGR02466 family protein [Kofleriaceae bacterium]